jgi:hypothetical protein
VFNPAGLYSEIAAAVPAVMSVAPFPQSPTTGRACGLLLIQLVREHAKEGFVDSLGLASCSHCAGSRPTGLGSYEPCVGPIRIDAKDLDRSERRMLSRCCRGGAAAPERKEWFSEMYMGNSSQFKPNSKIACRTSGKRERLPGEKRVPSTRSTSTGLHARLPRARVRTAITFIGG